MLSSAKGWLALAALALGTARGASVTFTEEFAGPFNASEAIFNSWAPEPRVFKWTAQNVVVENVILWASAFDDRSADTQIASASYTSPADGDTSTTISEVPPAASPGGSGSGSGRLGTRSPGQWPDDSKLQVTSSNQLGGSLSLSFDGLDVTPGQPLYFQALWESDGTAFSRAFTYIDPNNYVSMDPSHRSVFANDSPYREGRESRTGTSPTTAQPTMETPDSATPVTPNSGNTGDLAQDSGGGGGLSGGAVAGIAVACGVVALALIFGLVWWLLRRRRQRNAALPGGPYNAGNRADDLMAEKEGGADADADASPHSPYSDDGAAAVGGAHADEVAVGAAVAHDSQHQPQDHDQPRSFTPYSDRPRADSAAAAAATAVSPSINTASIAQTDEARVADVPSPTPGRTTPRGLTTPYAHLVEDGMTEDEIRRLEEEERQLDAAIEQAGRR